MNTFVEVEFTILFYLHRLQNNIYLIKLDKTLIELPHVGRQNVDSVVTTKFLALIG